MKIIFLLKRVNRHEINLGDTTYETKDYYKIISENPILNGSIVTVKDKKEGYAEMEITTPKISEI